MINKPVKNENKTKPLIFFCIPVTKRKGQNCNNRSSEGPIPGRDIPDRLPVNDAYTAYLSMNRPDQLNRQQADTIRNARNGAPGPAESIKVGPSGTCSKAFDIRENDVFQLNLVRL